MLYHRWILTDHLGSASVVLEAHPLEPQRPQGRAERETVHAPFGALHQDEGAAGTDTEVFAGHPREPATGLHYMQARWQNPTTGSFLSVDPVVGDAFDPGSLNAYSYVGNNPVHYIDPTGLREEEGGVPVFFRFSFGSGHSHRSRFPPQTSRQTYTVPLAVASAEPSIENEDLSQGIQLAQSDSQGYEGRPDLPVESPIFSPLDLIGLGWGLARAGAARVAGRIAGREAAEAGGRQAATAFGRSVEGLKDTISTGRGPWKLFTAHAEPATGRAFRGGTSIEEVFVNQETGERLVRHTIVRAGEVLHETFRPYAKFGLE
jgi:RHS repeat-associated protein